MNMHYCLTSDGLRIGCVCSTGRDHTEDDMDQGPGWESEDDEDEDGPA